MHIIRIAFIHFIHPFISYYTPLETPTLNAAGAIRRMYCSVAIREPNHTTHDFIYVARARAITRRRRLAAAPVLSWYVAVGQLNARLLWLWSLAQFGAHQSIYMFNCCGLICRAVSSCDLAEGYTCEICILNASLNLMYAVLGLYDFEIKCTFDFNIIFKDLHDYWIQKFILFLISKPVPKKKQINHILIIYHFPIVNILIDF